MRLRLGLFWLLLSSAVSAGPIDRLTLTASPISSFAPANLVVRVHVTPDPANRALEVIAESSDYFRSSRMQLDGEDALKTITLEFRGLPPGDYAVWGRLIDSAGHQRASVRRQVIVLASAGGGP
jgi:hypothetical protein